MGGNARLRLSFPTKNTEAVGLRKKEEAPKDFLFDVSETDYSITFRVRLSVLASLV